MHGGLVEQLCGSGNDSMQRRFGLPVDLDVRMRDELRRAGPRRRRRLHDGVHRAQLGPLRRRGLQRWCRGRVVRSQRLDDNAIVVPSVRCWGRCCWGVGGARHSPFVERGLSGWLGRHERELALFVAGLLAAARWRPRRRSRVTR